MIKLTNSQLKMQCVGYATFSTCADVQNTDYQFQVTITSLQVDITKIDSYNGKNNL